MPPAIDERQSVERIANIDAQCKNGNREQRRVIFEHIDEEKLQRARNGGGTGEKGPESTKTGFFGQQNAACEAHHKIAQHDGYRCFPRGDSDCFREFHDFIAKSLKLKA